VNGGARRRAPQRGQAVVEFALAIPIFMMLMMGVFDLGRGVYMWNGLSQAAREIARTTSVHPGITLGTSADTRDTVETQKALVPGLFDPPTYACIDIAGDVVTHPMPCVSGEYVRVTVTATYTPVTLFGMTGPISMSSTSSVQIP
jgi:hypothetical protein